MPPEKANIAYPALIFTRNMEIFCAPEPKNLTRWTKDAVENIDTIVGMELVDSNGKHFVIEEIDVIGEWKSPPLMMFFGFLRRGKPPEYEVNLTLTRAPRLTFKQIRARVRDVLIAKPEVYLFNYSPENDLPENAESIAAADDIDSLPSVLAELEAMKDFDEIYYQFCGDPINAYDGPIDVERYR